MTERDVAATGQPMTGALEELADAADETAREQQRLARRARRMVRQRQSGWAWSAVLERERKPGAIELLTASARRLVESSGRFRHALGRALAAEGLSIRQIARHLGVTHQRISAMLKARTP